MDSRPILKGKHLDEGVTKCGPIIRPEMKANKGFFQVLLDWYLAAV